MIKPDLNSHRIVARMIYDTCSATTKNNIKRGDAEGVHDLNLVTEGYAREVRDQLIAIVRAEWSVL